jgi:hypothetical protein
VEAGNALPGLGSIWTQPGATIKYYLMQANSAT